MTDIPALTAVETARMLRTKALSVREVTQAHLAHMQAVNPALNAVVEAVPDCMALAAQMDNAHPGEDAPPLWGVPITVKANIDHTGFATSNGLTALQDNIATDDSPVIANLKKAGAVIIGRTNTPELSLRWFTSNPLHGTTHNPWDARLTPGGSSGGAAAAVAAGIGTLAHGNDLGGSLRYPAYCCGVASIRPSMGRIAAHVPSAPAERPPMAAAMAVQGPIARSIADLRLGLDAMAQRDSNDPMWVAARDSGRARGQSLRVGFARDPFGDSAQDPAVTAAMDAALAGLKAAGIDTVETALPHANRTADLWGELLFAETDLLMSKMIAQDTTPEFQRMYAGYLAGYRKLDFAGYLAAYGARTAAQRAVALMFDTVDLFLMPTSMARPFENDLDFIAPDRMPEILAAQRPLHVVNLLGLPAVALPTGIVEGAPVGVQLMGPMHDDDFVLDVAERLETELGTLGLAPA